jgi:carbon storage regulator
MLILTRRVGESIHIGADIVITLVDPHPGQSRHVVRIGIEAPREVPIWRAELHPEKSPGFTSDMGNKGSGEAV